MKTIDISRITYEFVRLPTRSLDDKGRCCGRRPLNYKKPSPHFFCHRCGAEYSSDGVQQPNWAWLQDGKGWFKARYPESDSVADLLVRLDQGGCDNSQTRVVSAPSLETVREQSRAAAEKRESTMVQLPHEALVVLSELRQAWFPLGKTEDYHRVRKAMVDAWSK